jgi:hypothetical protein
VFYLFIYFAQFYLRGFQWLWEEKTVVQGHDICALQILKIKQKLFIMSFCLGEEHVRAYLVLFPLFIPERDVKRARSHTDGQQSRTFHSLENQLCITKVGFGF